jgi:hypothetical protein
MKKKNGLKKATRFLLLCFLFVALSFGAYAQKTVTGVVVDEGGFPLPGVSVIIKGTTTGTVTGIDGDFSLSGVNDNSTLVFSFMGMEPQEIFVGTQTVFNVTLVTQTIGLEEVVAIGYGTQKKATSPVLWGWQPPKGWKTGLLFLPGQGLQGVIPNLNITIRNGDPTLLPTLM